MSCQRWCSALSQYLGKNSSMHDHHIPNIPFSCQYPRTFLELDGPGDESPYFLEAGDTLHKCKWFNHETQPDMETICSSPGTTTKPFNSIIAKREPVPVSLREISFPFSSTWLTKHVNTIRSNLELFSSARERASGVLRFLHGKACQHCVWWSHFFTIADKLV